MMIGFTMIVGLYLGVRIYAPEITAGILSSLSESAGNRNNQQKELGADLVRQTVQDILASEQGRTIVTDLLNTQSRQVFQQFFKEAMESPEFRKALSDALKTFLNSPEGKALVRQIATEALTP